MKFKKRLLFAVFVQLIIGCISTTSFGLDLKAKIDPLARPLIEDGIAVGFIIGIVKDGETQVITYGEKTKGSNKAPDENTIFEIGSVSKVFTGILLADMVQKGVVRLDDPVQKYLPEGVTMPVFDGNTITLEHLATHTSGLPRMPDNFIPGDPSNPYADYSEEKLYEFLNGHMLRRPPGQYEYSNYGMGLLGHLLAGRMGKSFEQCIIDLICKPIGMTNTCIRLNEDQQKRFATPYNPDFYPEKPWDFDSLAGCGGIRSTGKDMIKFIKANINDGNDTLTRTLRMSHQELNNKGMAVGLAWHILPDGTRWHNGGTGGFHCWLGISTDRKAGVVVLANTSNMQITQFGMKVMSVASGKDVKIRKAIDMSPELLKLYSGVYSLAPNVTLTVTDEDGKLILQVNGQGNIPFFPESETGFFCKLADVQMSFIKDKEGKVDHLILHENGIDQKAMREGDVTELKKFEVGPDILESYTGAYMIAPDVAMTFTVENGKLIGSAPGMNSFQLLPESITEFIVKEIGAKISFVPDEDGKVNHMIIHHPGGHDQKAERKNGR